MPRPDFATFQFDQDPRWADFLAKHEYVGGSSASVEQELFLKRKFFKRYIDPTFDPNSTNHSSSSPPPNRQHTTSTRGTPFSSNHEFRLATGFFVANAVILLASIWWVFNPYGAGFNIALLSAMATYFASTYMRRGLPSMNMQSIALFVSDENMTYFFLGLLFLFIVPTRYALMLFPFCCFAFFQVTWYLVQIAPQYPLLQRYQPYIERLQQLQGRAALQVAWAEVLLLVLLVVGLFSGTSHIFAVFVYVQWLRSRWLVSSYSRQVWGRIGAALDSITTHPSCPGLLATVVRTIRSWVAVPIAPPRS